MDNNPSESRRLASRNLHSSHHTPPFTYATVTASSTSPPSSPSTSPSPLKPNETTRHHRTQILRRLPYNTTTQHVISDVTRQLGCTEDALFENVLRDPTDSRRFYLTYRTDELKQYATGKGFYVEHLHIKPTDNTTNGYIPFPPYYIDESTLQDLLKPYGTLVTGGFVKTRLNTRIAGYKFGIRIHKDKSPPTSIEYNGCCMDIKYDDDQRKCKYCGRYGNLIGKCRTKAADDLIHQQRRGEARDADWKAATQTILAEKAAEQDKIHQYHDDTLNAMAEVFEAALIAIKGTDDFAARKEAITAAHLRDEEESVPQFTDNMDILRDETDQRLHELNERYQRAGGVLPAYETDEEDATPDVRDAHDSAMEEDVRELIISAEHRLASQLQPVDSPTDGDPVINVLRETQVPTTPTEPTSPTTNTIDPATELSATPTIKPVLKPSRLDLHRKSRKEKSTVTPFQSLPPDEQDRLIAEATTGLGPGCDFKTYSRKIISFKTETSHITQLLRSHLFDTKCKQGYAYLNPMETVVCTSDQDESSRLIYVRDVEMSYHLMTFLQHCRDHKIIAFLDYPTCTENPLFKSDTDWT